METKTMMYCTLASPKSAMDRLWIWNIYSYVHMYVLYYADSTWMFFLGGDRRHVVELWYGILYIHMCTQEELRMYGQIYV